MGGPESLHLRVLTPRRSAITLGGAFLPRVDLSQGGIHPFPDGSASLEGLEIPTIRGLLLQLFLAWGLLTPFRFPTSYLVLTSSQGSRVTSFPFTWLDKLQTRFCSGGRTETTPGRCPEISVNPKFRKTASQPLNRSINWTKLLNWTQNTPLSVSIRSIIRSGQHETRRPTGLPWFLAVLQLKRTKAVVHFRTTTFVPRSTSWTPLEDVPLGIDSPSFVRTSGTISDLVGPVSWYSTAGIANGARSVDPARRSPLAGLLVGGPRSSGKDVRPALSGSPAASQRSAPSGATPRPGPPRGGPAGAACAPWPGDGPPANLSARSLGHIFL